LSKPKLIKRCRAEEEEEEVCNLNQNYYTAPELVYFS
jgi:hypothetical protein